RFELLASYTMYYFAGAIASEMRRRKGIAEPADGFLYSHDAPFRSALFRGYETLRELAAAPSCSRHGVDAFERQVARDIAPYNLAGLCDPAKRNMYPFV